MPGGRAVIPEGAFIRTLFPTDERPREPGLPHICYCVGATPALALVAYTSSQPLAPNVPVPVGVRVFGEIEAASLGQQRPFVLYLNRLARLPPTQQWFPELGTPGNGIVATASPALRQELVTLSEVLTRRHRETIRVSGPF